MFNYILPLLRNPTDSRLLFLLHKGAGRGCPVEERACWDRPGKGDEDMDDLIMMLMMMRRIRLYSSNLWMETTDPLLDPWVILDTWDILLISSFFPVNFPSCSDLKRLYYICLSLYILNIPNCSDRSKASVASSKVRVFLSI